MYWLSAVSLGVLLAFSLPSHAAALSAEDATELLAKAWMVDNRCNVLAKDDRDDLTQFVARAEISVAEKVSVKAAQQAIANGREQGKTMACDGSSADMVRDVLGAARAADGAGGAEPQQQAKAKIPAQEPAEPEQVSAANDTANAEPAPEPMPDDQVADVEEQPVVKKITPKPVRAAKLEAKPIAKKAAKPTAQVARISPKPIAKPKASKGSANAYSRTAETYYRELRCRKLSPRAVNAMYARVLREHQQAVAANGKSAVRAMLRAAEGRANSSGC